ncbi:hypothetical protein H310_06988 [Aphanomyces invadans]|uniref:Uncharacterized protein n=1 Tax=Aphanomyces invadans TaxID=157072 RepID=A0A024U6H7_9STRA|nr:hypothetical protein H310_06988 [Aphanomyces invadans]ETW01477.1 hypothetical protein H310_06988 [Aphanomyces invadans]|eukprot:XP_008870475.1 hypothetical protein H310_06988 [Aphanomyces invadans]
MDGGRTFEFDGMGLFDKHSMHGLEPRWLRQSYEPELTHIKNVLKGHDTRKNLVSLAFHKRVKPPVTPPEMLHHRLEMVAGKKVPFTVALATRGWPRMARLGVIPEGDSGSPTRRDVARSHRRREPRMVRVGRSIKLIP